MFKIFLVKMSFICMIIKNHFRKKDFALGLVLKQRLAASRKWPIALTAFNYLVFYCNFKTAEHFHVVSGSHVECLCSRAFACDPCRGENNPPR